jgi:hypothetical protein
MNIIKFEEKMPESKMIDNKPEEELQENQDVFSDIKYLCQTSNLIVDALRRGLDVAQLPSGDIIITELKVVNTVYSWDSQKQKMVKVSQS